ncbi:MAG: type II CAAX endopeptidase family protein, partial [Acidobacteriota bacterium]
VPGVELRSVVAAVPIAGVAVAVRDVLVGRFDLVFIALAWLSTSGAALLLVRAALLDLSSERLATAGYHDRAVHLGGIDLLSRHVLRYFAVVWAVIFLAAAGLGLGLRAQVLFNIGGVFLGGSLLLLAKYRLPVTKTLALRPVCPSVWAGVLLGAPSMFLVGVAVGQLSGRLFPLPQEALEALGKGLLPADMGLFELLFFVAVLPAVCEEVAFRGVLLQALRRRLAPLSVVLISAAVFAVFHIEWVRLLPTFFLGVLLALLTYATGSLWPAVVWHFINNATEILASRSGVDFAELGGGTLAWSAAAAVLAGVLIWRGRSPLAALDGARPPDS